MRIWKQPISVESLTADSAHCAVSHLGMEFVEVGDDFIRARVPVDARTRQPYGLLHGGVSVVLAEGFYVVGLDINANHLKGVRSGWVTGTTRAVHIGRSTQVWAIELHNEAGELVCVSRMAVAVLAPR